MSQNASIEQHHALGIGTPGEIIYSNASTRAVLVVDHIVREPKDLAIATVPLELSPPSVNRRIIKSITTYPFKLGTSITENSCLCVEACLPFDYYGTPLYWVIAGSNTSPRIPSESLIEQHKLRLHQIDQDGSLRPQSGKQLLNYARDRNNGNGNFQLTRITPDNFKIWKMALDVLYGEAFNNYPYDVVLSIEQNCTSNIYVIATIGNQIIAITGAEYMTIAGVSLAEIGDSASLPGIIGLGPVMKRFLMQTADDMDSLSDLWFTDSRISEKAAVIKANLRAGFKLNPDILLPLHTLIGSNKDPGEQVEIPAGDNSNKPIVLENMTMTFADRGRIKQVLSDYGKIPVNS